MKMTALVLAGLVATMASASYAGTPFFEEDYGRNSLAVAAIERGDWKTAETLLTRHDSGAQNDPAHLINLGRVYMATGRAGMALSAWHQAAASPNPYRVETGNGRTIWSSDLATALIARYQPTVQTAASN